MGSVFVAIDEAACDSVVALAVRALRWFLDEGVAVLKLSVKCGELRVAHLPRQGWHELVFTVLPLATNRP